MIDQEIIDKAVKIATRRALHGSPVLQIVWIPPQVASDDPYGSFWIRDCPPLNAGDTAPWDK